MIEMKCSGELNPWIVIQERSGILRATHDLANDILCWKKFDHVYCTIMLGSPNSFICWVGEVLCFVSMHFNIFSASSVFLLICMHTELFTTDKYFRTNASHRVIGFSDPYGYFFSSFAKLSFKVSCWLFSNSSLLIAFNSSTFSYPHGAENTPYDVFEKSVHLIGNS